jgi:hypothetical protein
MGDPRGYRVDNRVVEAVSYMTKPNKSPRTKSEVTLCLLALGVVLAPKR